MQYIIFDLEATCWDNEVLKTKNKSEIIEIGAVKVNDNLKIVSEFQVYIKPILHPKLSNFCTQLTGIEQKTVDEGKSFKEALKDFQNWIGDEEYYLCSFGFYDKKQMKEDCQLHNLSTSFLKNHISIKHQYMQNRGLKRTGMPSVLKDLGIKLEGRHHSGLDDSKNIAEIFIAIFDELKFV